MLALRWNLEKPFSFTAPPAEYEEFMRSKRLQALEIGRPGAAVGALVATLAAAVNSDFNALYPTLLNCAIFGTISSVVPVLARKIEARSA